MPFSSELAEIRFGCGLSPVIAGPSGPLDMLTGLNGVDHMAVKYPIDGYAPLRARLKVRAELRKQKRTASDKKQVQKKIKALANDSAMEGALWYAQSLRRWIHTDQGFRERLVAFWADHFTAMGKTPILRAATAPYIEEAIRPNISGHFADLLIATTTHPLMLHFLDQGVSVGPDSVTANRSKRLKGLNENLAREVLELHTLGVDGPYTQGDVRQLAELFTGLSFSRWSEFKFRSKFAEPGPETVLGKDYGGDPATLEPVLQSLRDLSVHPATAEHLARKLAVHFVSDTPDPDLIRHIAARYTDSDGNLMATYAALLEHRSGWTSTPGNVKPPADFIASAARALVPDPGRMDALHPRLIRRLLLRPLGLMGQPWQRPGGPDGWAEEDLEWITPQGISTRLRWALSVPQKLRPDLPDPREFVMAALGSNAPEAVRFAAKSAESRADAIGLVLASPAFQRR